jgi:hypothetical protein
MEYSRPIRGKTESLSWSCHVLFYLDWLTETIKGDKDPLQCHLVPSLHQVPSCFLDANVTGLCNTWASWLRMDATE